MATTVEFNIDWSVFDAVQKQLLENALQNGHYEQLAAILYEVTPTQAQEIAKIQRQMRPREFKFDSKAQQDFEAHINTIPFSDLTPELAHEWQAKIDAEKAEKLAAMNGGLTATDVKNVDGSNTTSGMLTNDLNEVKGLGPASVKRLNAANIYSVDELRKLDMAERKKILGVLVANKIKSLT